MGRQQQQQVAMVWLGLCNSVWFGISVKLRNREGWWDQVPLDQCLIETDAPYLGGGREDRIYSPTQHTLSLQLHPHTGWWTTSGNNRLPPVARVMGVGRQQQQQVAMVWLGLCNSVWFGISVKLRNREGWWDQVPLDQCLIETDAPYLGGGREDRIYSPYFGSEGLERFCKGADVPRRMVGAILAQNLWDFYGVA